jgi:23S rRNA (cytidine1920-2'-O)/16S rRNA (cytidine1409-2'-O)-methyltransferase
MRLDQELVLRGLCESRQEAKECIDQGFVLVDGVITKKQTKIIQNTSHIEVTSRRKFVSRGGQKLEAFLFDIFGTEENIRNSLRGLEALDIGSSTGGFTDCLLQCGVKHVVAVDVGTSQLHKKLEEDPRVSSHQNTDIRSYHFEKKFDVVVADLSFITLEKVLSTIISFGHKDTMFFLLIKPQFEVGFGNTKKGIVKNKALVLAVLEHYKQLFLSYEVENCTVSPCKLLGGDGNQEYFIFGKK